MLDVMSIFEYHSTEVNQACTWCNSLLTAAFEHLDWILPIPVETILHVRERIIPEYQSQV